MEVSVTLNGTTRYVYLNKQIIHATIPIEFYWLTCLILREDDYTVQRVVTTDSTPHWTNARLEFKLNYTRLLPHIPSCALPLSTPWPPPTAPRPIPLPATTSIHKGPRTNPLTAPASISSSKTRFYTTPELEQVHNTSFASHCFHWEPRAPPSPTKDQG